MARSISISGVSKFSAARCPENIESAISPGASASPIILMSVFELSMFENPYAETVNNRISY